jgi:hypothetical protein
MSPQSAGAMLQRPRTTTKRHFCPYFSPYSPACHRGNNVIVIVYEDTRVMSDLFEENRY